MRCGLGMNRELPVTGADSLARTLLAAGVDTVFANPGTTEMPIVEALGKIESSKVILCLHETVCSGAADGYGRMLGKPACVLVHLGVGLANATSNLHNAKRASTPVLVIVGDIATWHVDKDPVLASDIAGLAGFTSRFVRTCDSSPDRVSFAVSEALTAIRDYRSGESRIATLIVPHDTQRNILSTVWTSPTCRSIRQDEHENERVTLFEMSLSVHEDIDGNPMANEMLSCAQALLRFRGSCAMVVGGSGLTEAPAFSTLAAIQSLSRCELWVENAFSRVQRGSGQPNWHRIPYFPADAERCFCSFNAVILCGVRRPVAMFGYSDGVSDVIPQEVMCLQLDTMDVPGALMYLWRTMLTVVPELRNEIPESSSAQSVPFSGSLLEAQSGTSMLSAQGICNVLASVQPAEAIVVDESVTTGTAYWDASRLSKPFAHLTLTGGSIGCGPPLAVGCGIACPLSQVINFQADGSALYSTPAFWTQASEALNVTTIICANNKYEILKLEMRKQGLLSTKKAEKLTSLTSPIISWVAIAHGYGVDGIRVKTAADLEAALLRSFSTSSPYLIEASV
mmetsp:Transcript_18063/g.55297  ORF Transcript_18063/g.55297 Transcript_18063/m.55297 type:complete len:568 (-) Transcript_18063:376-2079(-)